MKADFPIRTFGAKGDGVTQDTAAIQAALDAAGAAGGGRVVLKDGTFLTGSIQLRSGVELHLDESARLLASADLADFPDRQDVRHVTTENLPRRRNACVIFADEAEDVAITGGGVIDGNGAHHVCARTEPDWTGWAFDRIHPMHESLPRVVFLAGCRDVRLEDVSLVNAPGGWGYWIHDCDRVAVRHLAIRTDVRYPNNDGIHVNCSRDVDIEGCDIECGDDALVIRANSRSLAHNAVCERVHARDCRVRSWASGIRVGWMNDGVIRDCSFSRIAMRDTTNGIDIVLPRQPANPDYGREATLIERIVFEDIDMDGIYAHPIDAKIAPDPATRVAAVRDLAFRRIRARGLQFPHVCGRADAPFSNFLFEDCSFRKVPDAELPGWERHGAAAWGRNLVEAFAHAEGFRFDRTTFDCR